MAAVPPEDSSDPATGVVAAGSPPPLVRVVTALAPFRAAQRALVLDPMRTVSVRLAQGGKDGIVVVDGQHEQRLDGGESVTAYRSPRPASFVRFGSRFFQQLHGKRILPWVDEPGDGDSRNDADLPAHP